MNMKKTIAAAMAALLTLAIMTGCSDNEAQSGSSATDNGPVSSDTVTTRPLEEGDILAIHKINTKTEGETLPGGYKLVETNEQDQGKLYANGKSKIVIRALNYNTDMQDLAVWADNACAMIRIANITSACDTIFEDPQNTTVCGYDAIMYNYDILQYEFIDNETKKQIDTYKGRNYYFYSDKDAYVLMFDTNDEDWEEQTKCFDEFIADLEITNVEY